jgi:hypothetical protein
MMNRKTTYFFTSSGQQRACSSRQMGIDPCLIQDCRLAHSNPVAPADLKVDTAKLIPFTANDL